MKQIVTAMLLAGLTTELSASTPPAGGLYTAQARVVHVEAIYDSEQIRTPVEHCRWEYAPAVTRRYLNNGQPQYVRKRIKRCHTRVQSEYRQVVKGYNVRLSYNGIVFERDMPRRPSSYVPITVEISPDQTHHNNNIANTIR